MSQKLTTLLADRHPVALSGLRTCLLNDTAYTYHIIGTTSSGRKLLTLCRQHRPRLLIMDINLREMDGLHTLEQLDDQRSSMTIIILSDHLSPGIINQLKRYGVQACIHKSVAMEELRAAIWDVLKHKHFVHLPSIPALNADTHKRYQDSYLLRKQLTRREREVLLLIAEAHSNKEIADRLFISDQTVGVHRKNIMRKLGVSNTAALVRAVYDYHLW